MHQYLCAFVLFLFLLCDRVSVYAQGLEGIGVCSGTDFNGLVCLDHIDPQTGLQTPISTVIPVDMLSVGYIASNLSAFDPTLHRLAFVTFPGTIYVVDTQTGATTTSSPAGTTTTSFGAGLSVMQYDSGTLYGIFEVSVTLCSDPPACSMTQPGSGFQLGIINPETGVATPVNQPFVTFPGSEGALYAGFYPIAHQLYFYTSTGQLWIVNTQTGTATHITPATYSVDVQFDSGSGALYGLAVTPFPYNPPSGVFQSVQFGTIDPQSWAFTPITTIASSSFSLGEFSFDTTNNFTSALDPAGHRFFFYGSPTGCTDGGCYLYTVNTQTGATTTSPFLSSNRPGYTPAKSIVFDGSPSTGPVQLVDPVPSLLNGPQITGAVTAAQASFGQPYLADLTRGRIVKGVATDGVAQVVLRIPATTAGQSFTVAVRSDQCNNLSISDCVNEYGLVFDPSLPPANLLNNPAPQTIMVTAVSTTNGPMAFAAYRAPLDFVRSGSFNADDQGAPKRSAFLSINNGTLPDAMITLVRPPVVLIHGIWSDPSTWDYFSPLVNLNNPTIYDSRFSVTRLDYGATNSEGFNGNANVILPQLEDYINKFKDASQPCIGCSSLRLNVASVQADIIAHSMGGDIVRSFVTLPTFIRTANYNSGDVHKLISIDTPYTGSQFANNLMNSNIFCKTEFSNSGKGIGGGVSDLAVGSVALKTLQQPEVGIAAHAIVGTASIQQTMTAETNAVSLGLTKLCPSLLPTGHFQDVFMGASDLIVSQSSQQGIGIGLLGGSPPSDIVPGIIHAVDSKLFSIGPDALSRGGISNNVPFFLDSGNGQRAIDLLNSPVNGPKFFAVRP